MTTQDLTQYCCNPIAYWAPKSNFLKTWLRTNNVHGSPNWRVASRASREVRIFKTTLRSLAANVYKKLHEKVCHSYNSTSIFRPKSNNLWQKNNFVVIRLSYVGYRRYMLYNCVENYFTATNEIWILKICTYLSTCRYLIMKIMAIFSVVPKSAWSNRPV